MKRLLISSYVTKLRFVGLVLMLTILLGWATPLAAQVAGPTWKLMDYQQSVCFSPKVTSSYYGIWIQGSWTHPINIGISNLPSGGSYSTVNAPIPPGTSTGQYSLAYVKAQIPATTPVGTYTASLWARAGQTKQTVPVTLVVKSRCGY